MGKRKRNETVDDLAAWFIVFAEAHYNGQDAKCKSILTNVQAMLEQGLELPTSVAEKIENYRLRMMIPLGNDPH
jgi:hypothetical protein